MKRINHKLAREAARDYDHGRDLETLADELGVDVRRLFRKAIPILHNHYGYPISLLRYKLAFGFARACRTCGREFHPKNDVRKMCTLCLEHAFQRRILALQGAF